MAVKIRLMRVGKKKQPSYRVVVADARSPRDGRIIETIGHYGPRAEPSQVEIDADRALDWLRKGAKPTEPVQKLLTVAGVWATFAAERPGTSTKLDRRGQVAARGGPAAGGAKATAAPRAAVASDEAEAAASSGEANGSAESGEEPSE